MSAPMPRRRRCAAGLGLGLVAVGLAVAGPAAPAYAAACSSVASGVTVVVDFSAFGAGVRVGCAPGDPATGLDALRGAGFAVTGTQRWGTAFVCRIDNRPTGATEPCVNTPPATAYWGYWHAPRGGAWSYSNVGGASYNPAPGTVEGWAFGSGARPGIAPPAVPKPPQPSPPPAPAKTPAAPPPAAGGGGTGGGTGGPRAAGESADAAAPATPTASSGAMVTGPAPDVSTIDTAAGWVPPPAEAGGGGLIGVAAGAVLVAALAGLAVWTARRRAGGGGEGPL